VAGRGLHSGECCRRLPDPVGGPAGSRKSDKRLESRSRPDGPGALGAAGLLINVVFGGILIGKTLPSVRRIWDDAAPDAILGSVFSFGQFAIGGLVVTFLLTPVFGLPDSAGSIIEMSFAGGHGTIAGMGGLLRDAGAGELVDVGLGLATLSMLTGVIGGTVLVNWAVRKQSACSSSPACAPSPTLSGPISSTGSRSFRTPSSVGSSSSSC
jgi:Na+/glutamate symporter